jgi:hypothetical protein
MSVVMRRTDAIDEKTAENNNNDVGKRVNGIEQTHFVVVHRETLLDVDIERAGHVEIQVSAKANDTNKANNQNADKIEHSRALGTIKAFFDVRRIVR